MDTSYFENIQDTGLSLSERVAEQISQLIIDRHLTSKDKLPNEFELASQLNVGRGTVREAIKLLIARNVLIIRRGKGTYIAEHPGQIPDPLGFAYYPNQMQLALDLLEIRTQLEPWIAAEAARRATADDLDDLRAKCLLVEQEIQAGRNHLPKDVEFHTSIAQCTQNLVVPKLIPVITYSIGLFGSLNGNVLQQETLTDHRAITEAICRRDPDTARAAMLQHMEFNRAELEKIVAELKQ